MQWKYILYYVGKRKEKKTDFNESIREQAERMPGYLRVSVLTWVLVLIALF